MPHVSSPIAYPCSSSPPAVQSSLIDSRKRVSDELQVYPSKKRTKSGSEQLDRPAQTLLGSSVLLEKPIDANKENLSPRKSSNQVIDTALLDGSDTRTNLQHLASDSLRPSHKRALNGIAKIRSGVASVEKFPQTRTSQGDVLATRMKQKSLPTSSTTSHMSAEAKSSFYGIKIYNLLQQLETPPEADRNAQDTHLNRIPPAVAVPPSSYSAHGGRSMLWTEKYRARRFTDLIGDDRTHREVLRWLKSWDSVVFPSSLKPKASRKSQSEEQELQNPTKILMLTGSPGLGKTTLAHVCAKQAGYEVLEINASDERSRDVVKGKIKDCVGSENVKGVNIRSDDGKIRKKGRPFCVIVDEVDGAVSGGSSGEGGFIKALVDLVLLDRKTSSAGSNVGNGSSRATKKGDRFRILRPIILICNDIYHPSLRPLRATTIAEIAHIRKPPLDKVVSRIGSVFDREGIPHDNDGVRRLCEATWGLKNRREVSSQFNGPGEGDLRSVLVAAEWVASILRQDEGESPRLTKKWIEDNMLKMLSQSGGGARGIGRGNTREVVDRVFQDGAGFTNSELVSSCQANLSSLRDSDAQRTLQSAKRAAMQRLQEMAEANGESDHIITDCFAAYPSRQFQDDTFLSKPNAAYDWLFFHDRVSSRIHCGQEWDLHGYLSQATLGLHHLFASPTQHFGGGDKRQWTEDAEKAMLFMGSRPDFEVSEVTKENKAILRSFQSSFSTTSLRRFGSSANISTDLLPHVLRMLMPQVKPVIIGASGVQRGVVSVRKEGERRMIQRAVNVMSAVGVSYQKCRVDSEQVGVPNYIYRMEP